MNHKILLAVLSVALIIPLFVFSACGADDGDAYTDLETNAVVYDMGEQEVVVTIKSEESSSTFKQTISKNDIELGESLDGITVKDVKFVSGTKIIVSLSGVAKKRADNQTYGTITVKASGKNGKGKSVCPVTVDRPGIMVKDYFSSSIVKDGKSINNITCSLEIDAGEFIGGAVGDNVRLAEGTAGTLSASVGNDGTLDIRIENCDKKNPEVVIGSGATTFGKEVVLTLGLLSLVKF